MPYAFSTIDPSTTGQIARWDIPLNQWMGLKFESGQHDTAFGAVERFTEDQIYSNGSIATPEVANKAFGIPGYLDFKEPIEIQRAALMHERKTAELRRMAYLNTATHSGWGPKAALGTLSGMAGGVSNPLDFSLMFMPFVGSEIKAAGIAKLGGGAFRQGLERGLITEEALAASTRFPKFSASVINATFGSAAAEIPNFIQSVRDQVPYTAEDAAANVFLGGLTGGAFHIVGAALGKVLKLAADSHARLDPDAQDAAARAAVNHAMDNASPNADRIAATDRNVIARDLAFDEAAARERALVQIGVLPEEAKARALLETVNKGQSSATDLLDMIRARANVGGVEGGIAARLLERFHQGERGVEVFNAMADLTGVRYNPLAPTVQERFKEGLLFGPQQELKQGVVGAYKTARGNLYEIDRVLEQALKNLHTAEPGSLMERALTKNIHNLQERRTGIILDMEKYQGLLKEQKGPMTPDELSAHADELAKSGSLPNDEAAKVLAAQLEARADEIREQRIQALIDAERAQHAASLEDRVDAAYQQQLKQEIEAGKILSDEQVKELTKDPKDTASLALAKESIANLEKELNTKPAEAIGEGKPAAETPADAVTRTLFEEQTVKMDAEDAKVKAQQKAYDVAADCLSKIIKP